MNPKDTVLYVPIDFVGSDLRAREFGEKLSADLVSAQTRIESDELPIKLALKTTVIDKGRNGWGVGEEGMSHFDEGIKRIRRAGIDYHVETWPSGPTRSMYGVLFDQGAIAVGFSAIATGDLDQFPPQKNLDNLLQLHDRVKTTDSLLGVGSRNVPIVLAYNERNQNLRRIMEGIYNLAVLEAGGLRSSMGGSSNLEVWVAVRENGNEIHKPDITKAPNDPAYSFHGDCITGVYLFNPSNEKAGKFVDDVVSTAEEHSFFGFEDEYYMAIRAATLGDIAVRYFNSVPNSFEPIGEAEEREAIIKKQIQAPLRKLAGTNIRNYLERVDPLKDLSKFYPVAEISDVMKRMNEVSGIWPYL